MKSNFLNFTLILSALVLLSCGQQKKAVRIFSEQKIVQAAIKGEKSKGLKINYKNDENEWENVSASITGDQASYWKLKSIVPYTLQSGQSIEMEVAYQPGSNFIGISVDTLVLNLDDEKEIMFQLRGLSTKALEGKNEPPLADVVKTLGYGIDLGWFSLGNNVDAALQGDEIPPSLFQKAGSGSVEMIPVARYSPPFVLPFGYYFNDQDTIQKFEVGVLADSDDYPEHQTLFPATSIGKNSFDPCEKQFGFYTTSPSHDAYTEDRLNALWFKKNVAHAARTYEIKDSKGNILPNQYMVCFEEASNGDYQDYVFLVKNIRAVAL